MDAQTTHIVKVFVVTCLLQLVSACGGGSSGSNDPVNNQTPPADFKVNELEFIDTELRRLHPDLFFTKSQTAYENDLASFKSASAGLSDTEFRLEMAKFIAELGDQHTYIAMPIDIMNKFPIKVWWQQNKGIVIETSQAYRGMLGHELVSIDNTPLWELKDVGMRYLAHQNLAWKDALSPRFIHLADVLEHEGMIADANSASFLFENPEGQEFRIEIESQTQINDWVSVEELSSTTPLYKLSTDNYFYTYQDNILYIQYNSARPVSGYSLSDFIGDIQFALANNPVEKVVVDIRFNYGGYINFFLPVINFLAQSEFNQSDRLFVLTGRNSFSSAVGAIYAFQRLTEATFVGGPTGGKPNGFSHVIGYNLNGSLNTLYMSTDYLAVTEEDVDSFYPEHLAQFTQQDFITGRDPAITYILSNWPH